MSDDLTERMAAAVSGRGPAGVARTDAERVAREWAAEQVEGERTMIRSEREELVAELKRLRAENERLRAEREAVREAWNQMAAAAVSCSILGAPNDVTTVRETIARCRAALEGETSTKEKAT